VRSPGVAGEPRFGVIIRISGFNDIRGFCKMLNPEPPNQ